MTAFARYNKKTPTQKSEARIVSIAISPDCQGEGLGTLLFSSVLTTLQEHRIGLNVRPGNTAARRLYQAAGFQSVGSTKDLAGEWLIFVRPPKDPAVS
jgi:ribosomal protein S18 acetylase RimI-like enzyme